MMGRILMGTNKWFLMGTNKWHFEFDSRIGTHYIILLLPSPYSHFPPFTSSYRLCFFSSITYSSLSRFHWCLCFFAYFHIFLSHLFLRHYLFFLRVSTFSLLSSPLCYRFLPFFLFLSLTYSDSYSLSFCSSSSLHLRGHETASEGVERSSVDPSLGHVICLSLVTCISLCLLRGFR